MDILKAGMVAALVTLGVPAGAGAAVEAPRFRVERIAFPDTASPVDEAYAAGLNNHGEVIGISVQGSGDPIAFSWRQGQTRVVQPLPAGGPDGFSGAVQLSGINDQGVIVGRGYSAAHQAFVGVRWDSRAAAPVVLPRLGAVEAAEAINNQGVVAGIDGVADQRRAVLWQDGNPTRLEHVADPQQRLRPDQHDLRVHDLNDRGQVVGEVKVPVLDAQGQWVPRSQAGLWQDGSFQQLASTVQGWYFARGAALNEAGQVAGTAVQEGGDTTEEHAASRAALWSDGAMTLLDSLAGATTGRAFDINEAGWVVGASGQQAALWIDGQAMSLVSLLDGNPAVFAGWDLRRATDVNDRGQVLVEAWVGGRQELVLLTPVPEPGSVALTLGGLGALAWRWRRRAGVADGKVPHR